MKLPFVILASAFLLSTAAFAGGANDTSGMNMGDHGNGNGNGPPDFVNQWHGLGPNHQKDQNPGDTAADRHNFLDATAGNSGKSPTEKSQGIY